ncbi:Regulatory protein LuxO [BD1-7 clade bacterium]|uniref:Regulatory protein LuxO n=1 Tax=BD1-7 clade bacterium TaxID=2029982 RepID=A0A5S9QXS0_9GAMM|nr:Regulatory protein LuxO [BD1-7 clade bacterium]
MSHPTDDNLIELAIDMANSLREPDRFDRLITNVRMAIGCDAVVLLRLHGRKLIPLAHHGLIDEAMGRRFDIDDQPRFRQICQSKGPLDFPADCKLPDPYDGIIAGAPNIRVHSCMGIPLYDDDELFGVLTLDSLESEAFKRIPERTLDIISAMAAATLNTAILIQTLEDHRREHHPGALKKGSEIDEMIGQSPQVKRLRQEIDVVATSDYTVLIEGETGVGKELVARMIHNHSGRSDARMVYVNCAAIPEQLVESELFGHLKGAFTGADRNRAGKFSLADGGTLFLDEIGELPLGIQSTLLRVLQNQEIQPVGQDTVEKVNVRVLAATNRELEREVAEGRFRADLYHRLSVYPISVPPLRDRAGDIALLSGYFAEQVRRNLGISNLTIDDKTLEILQAYQWPGNIRELEHIIRRASLKARARYTRTTGQGEQPPIMVIEASDVEHLRNQPAISTPEAIPEVIPTGISLREATENYQRRLVQQALDVSDGSWASAARQLQTDRGNLNRLAKRLGVSIKKTVTAEASDKNNSEDD